MADEIDRANDQQAALMSAAIDRARAGAAYSIQGRGSCISCGAIVKPVVVNDQSIIGRWCSVECRNDDQR